MEKLDVEDVNIFASETHLADSTLLSDCYLDWAGFGLEDWPPKLIAKPRVQGFEIFVNVPAMRDTSTWDNGRMQHYLEQKLVFDVQASTRVEELKQMIADRIRIPSKRQKLTAHVRSDLISLGQYMELDDDFKTLADFDLEKHCVSIRFEKAQFDENGDYIFDDAFWDEQGYHAQPQDSWIPKDSLANRSRPDAHAVDPNQPLSIASDRRAAAAQK
ncbi:unnamed protein product [Polarella glacialis]|nr:unnamed protein product [Polarella glacialis]